MVLCKCCIACAPSGRLSVTSLCVIAPQEEALLAYQVCFDLFENEMQSFLLKARVWCHLFLLLSWLFSIGNRQGPEQCLGFTEF